MKFLRQLANNLDSILTEDLDEHSQKALEIFGKTYYKTRAGFMLKDGTMVDLTYGGNPREDHRAIQDIFSDKERLEFETATDALIAFMNEGNVRLAPEVPGIDVSVEPTEAQYKALVDYIQYFVNTQHYFNVDFSSLRGEAMGNKEFEGFTRPQEIIEFIRKQFN